MTNKKLVSKKARAIRNTIKGLTLPQSVKMAKLYLKGDRVAVLNLIYHFGYTVTFSTVTDDDGVTYGTATITKGRFSVTVPYTDGIIL